MDTCKWWVWGLTTLREAAACGILCKHRASTPILPNFGTVVNSGGAILKKLYLCVMVKRKEKIEDPLKLLLPGAIYDYFELVHTEVSDVDVHLFLDEQHIPPKRVGYESKGFTEQSIIQDFPLRGKPVFLHIRRRKWLEKSTGKVLTNSYDLTHLGTQITAEFADFLKGIYRE